MVETYTEAHSPTSKAKQIWRLFIVAAVLVTSLGLISLLSRGASAADSGQAFVLSPPLKEISGNPGQTIKDEIKLTNISKADMQVTVNVHDFAAKDESGTPQIDFKDQENSPTISLRQWVSAPPSFLLKAGETMKVPFEIAIPANAEPGGHYGVIQFSGASTTLDKTGVGLSASVGTLVLLKVSGNITEKASLAEFYSATLPNYVKSSFMEYGPVGFVLRVQNEGNLHIKPTGTIDITDMFGKKISTLRVNGDPSDPRNQPHSILPDSIRRFEMPLDKSSMFGRYTADLNLMYGTHGQVIQSTITFWVIPWKLILGIILGVIILAVLLAFGIKHYNKHIVRKAKSKL